MKANELRIGNLFYLIDRGQEVHIPIHTPFKVYCIDPFRVFGCLVDKNFATTEISEFDWFDSINISPIPLTEDWLLRLGFTAENIHANFKFDCFEIASTIRVVSTNVRSNFYLDGEIPEWMKIRLEYVHQLQNLYFALTGEELTVK